LYRDLFPFPEIYINCGKRCSSIEGTLMITSQNSQTVSSNFISEITIGHNSISPDNYQINPFMKKNITQHIICDQIIGDPSPIQLPCCQTGSLQYRTGFRDKDSNLFTLFVGSTNNA